MSDEPPSLPPDFPVPPPPPPPPPGFESEDEEEEIEGQPQPELEQIPPPPPPGFDFTESQPDVPDSAPPPPSPPTGFMEMEEREISEDGNSQDTTESADIDSEVYDEPIDQMTQSIWESNSEEAEESASLKDSLEALGDSTSDSEGPDVKWDDAVSEISDIGDADSTSDQMSTPIVSPTSQPCTQLSAKLRSRR